MLRWLSRWFVVFALIFALGAHWAILQSVAWTSMVIAYSQKAPLKEALQKTFDGQHPCRLCRFVAEGQKSEQRQHARPVVKLDVCFVAQRLTLFPPRLEAGYPARMDCLPAPAEALPTPPPRRLHG